MGVNDTKQTVETMEGKTNEGNECGTCSFFLFTLPSVPLSLFYHLDIHVILAIDANNPKGWKENKSSQTRLRVRLFFRRYCVDLRFP